MQFIGLPLTESITDRVFFVLLYGVWILMFHLWFAVGTVLWVAAMRVSRFLPEPTIEATVRKGPFLLAR